jgi:hypothetical protein
MPNDNQNSDDELLTQPATCRYFGNKSAMTLWRWRKAGILPPPIVINGRPHWTRAMLKAVVARHSQAAA